MLPSELARWTSKIMLKMEKEWTEIYRMECPEKWNKCYILWSDNRCGLAVTSLPLTQRARVRSQVGSIFCLRFFPGFSLNRKTNVRKFWPVADLGFMTLLTSQVISVAFYSEREKFDKFCSEALISAWGSFTCRKSTTQDPRLYFPSKGSHTQDFYALKKIHRPRPGLNPRTSDPVASMITTEPPGSTKFVPGYHMASIYHPSTDCDILWPYL